MALIFENSKEFQDNKYTIPKQTGNYFKAQAELLKSQDPHSAIPGHRIVDRLKNDGKAYNEKGGKKNGEKQEAATLSANDAKVIKHRMKASLNANGVDSAKNRIYASEVGKTIEKVCDDAISTAKRKSMQVQAVKPVKPNAAANTKPAEVKTETTPNGVKYQLAASVKPRKVMKESEDDWHPYYDAIPTPYEILVDFLTSNEPKQHWELIEPRPYQKALQEFMQYGQFVRFPTDYIYHWMDIIMTNTGKLRANGEWLGKEMYFPIDDLIEAAEEYPDKFKDAIAKYGEINENNNYEILDYIGFYDWMELPDGSIGGSDYGTPKLEKVIYEYRKGMPPEKVIVIINKALDVAHCQGDLSSAFIKGGRKMLTKISCGLQIESKRNKKIYISESQVIKLK